MHIRQATPEDFEALYPILHEVIASGETYAYPRATSREEIYRIWMLSPQQTYVAEKEGEIVGTYSIKPNQPGQGSHVCNCGYMVSSKHRGKGIAKAMCEHSQQTAIELGYKAMQFNLVVSSNEVAVKLWKKMGFEVVGCLPKAFKHATLGYIDALVMYRWLGSE